MFALTLTAQFAFGCVTQAGEPTQAQPADLVRQAVRDGNRRVVIPPGTYRLPPGIVVRNARDLEIVADGVTFVFTGLSRGITFDRCKNVTLHGLTLDSGQTHSLALDLNLFICLCCDHNLARL